MQITQCGKATSIIVIGNNATWLERHTAEEFRDYIEKISGASLLITAEQDIAGLTGAMILIGRPETCELIRAFDTKENILPAQSTTENDCVAIVVRDNTLIISGSNDRSVHYSACHLLEKKFGVGFYFDGDTFEKNPDITLDDMTMIERSPFRFRHTIGQWVYNFGAFLNADERKRELDMYARNKINSYRFYSWNTYVRKRTFQKLGVEVEPITDADIQRLKVLREMDDYARKLGIETMVPLISQETSIAFREKYPDAHYFGSEWVKDDNAAPETVPCLYPDDPMYKVWIKTFVETWIESVGPSKHFSCCPPSENHISTTIDEFININIMYAKYTSEALHEILPDAVFFMDGWGVRANTPPSIWTMPNVMQRFVDAMPDDVVFLDLWPNRKETDSTFREPMYRDANYKPLRHAHILLEPINEFGGDDHMHGDFDRHIEAAKEMTNPEVVDYGEGFGNCTELCGVSNHFFDLIFQLAWNPADVSTESFIRDTARRRYGESTIDIGTQAMENLYQAVYCDRDSSHARYQKRCYLERPQRRLVPVGESLEVAKYLDKYMQIMSTLPEDKKTRAVGQDMFDVMRQYITEYFNMHMRTAFELFRGRKAVDKQTLHSTFNGHVQIMEQLLTALECMTRNDKNSYVESKVRQYSGRACDPDVSGADCHIPDDFRAYMRDLGTTFVKTIPNLVDYPSRDYYELIENYYHKRVSACLDYLSGLLDDNGSTSAKAIDDELEARYHVIENNWIDVGYTVTDECDALHMPLWKAAEQTWNMLRTLPLDEGLDKHWENVATSEVIDVFASFSENADAEQKQERSWVSENPFEKKD